MASALLAVVILTLGFTTLAESVFNQAPQQLDFVAGVARRFQIVNPYGLFAVMTTTRPEIIIQGSNDGAHWQNYEFRYKPGDLRRAPTWIEPLQPRLDWQMWFAALGSYQSNPWFTQLMLRLLQGSPPVLGLFGKNPFPDHPPRLVRALLFDYSFSDTETLRRTGRWWQSRPLGGYFPAAGLKQP